MHTVQPTLNSITGMSVSQSAVPTLPTNALIEPSGTLDQVHHTAPPQSNGSTTNTLPVERTVSSKSTDSEGQALEWHEVIELQAFSERKVWIEEKIKVHYFLRDSKLVQTRSCLYSYWNKCHLSKSSLAWTPYALPLWRSPVFRLKLNSRTG